MGKRNELMVVEDRARVCELLARGHRNKSEMARIINEGRPEELHISPQQIGKDIEAMKQAYLEKGFEDLKVYRQQAEQELLYLVKVSYDSFEQSRKRKITLETMKAVDSPEEYEGLFDDDDMEQQDLDGNLFGREGKVKEEFRGEGNPAFLNTIKACLDSLNKIRGVDGTTKVALTDPSGTEEYLGIADVMKSRLDELSTRKIPEEMQKRLLEPMPEPENVIDGEFEEIEEPEI